MNEERTMHQWEEGWICPVCKQARKADGYDPCIPALPGVMFACCGHGGKVQNDGYIYFENGVCIRIVTTSISYDDGRPSIQVEMISSPIIAI